MPFAHLTLAVRDVDRSRDFFATALHWRPIDRPSNIPMRAAWLEIAPGQELHLVEVDDRATGPFDREYGRHVALRIPAAECPALRERLAALGAEVIAARRPTPFARFFFRDPEGYVFEVIEDA